AGTGWVANSWATSKASDMLAVRITPDCANRVATAVSDITVAFAARPGLTSACRPDFTAITGLVRASARARRVNLRGLPNDSRYSRTTSVRSSDCQYWSRSLPETSARFPAETNEDRPSPRPAASARIAMPSAPDWQKNPTRPGGGTTGARVPLSRTARLVLTSPRQLGPITRIPFALARATMCRWAEAPDSSASANPAVITTNPCTPLARQDSTTSATDAAGTVTTARSTGSGMSVTDA